MWICSTCGEKHEDQFNSCWKCNQTRSGSPVVTAPEREDTHPLCCARCATRLDYVGSKRFHEGARWGVLGELGELFVNRECFDVFVCPRCGRVEFFVEGIGEEFRPPVKERGAGRLLSEASKLEAEGKVREALALYQEAATHYADTEAGRDALRSIEALRRKLQ
jgi:hypothetical protein